MFIACHQPLPARSAIFAQEPDFELTAFEGKNGSEQLRNNQQSYVLTLAVTDKLLVKVSLHLNNTVEGLNFLFPLSKTFMIISAC
jgi:hypothetical protein